MHMIRIYPRWFTKLKKKETKLSEEQKKSIRNLFEQFSRSSCV